MQTQHIYLKETSIQTINKYIEKLLRVEQVLES